MLEEAAGWWTGSGSIGLAIPFPSFILQQENDKDKPVGNSLVSLPPCKHILFQGSSAFLTLGAALEFWHKTMDTIAK